MSGGLAPSKSTVYVSNLPFSLTNNDIHKIFEKYGRVAKVTIMRDPETRRSKGVAFVLFIEREAAHLCCRALNNTQMFSRTIKCTIAKDNGRASEFIRKKVYKDKSRCYECGEEGHLSYKCPKNLLGDREPPPKKDKRKRNAATSEEDVDDGEGEGMNSLAAALQYQQQMSRSSENLSPCSSYSYNFEEPRRKKYKKDAYFSDEEELDDG